ncbi:hypothetical protein BT63DRAFT_452174 [Microthyrium microscopicum]|uniref:2EXR domain-containing protein n=1 Tax=Microthyrium microscopicum TaxID=703497 RepID=A0A6A6UHC2_9PEZI|nr:hypothetical protein BT63DRAFT_452174 [Microthyrium microscopicum]
MAIQFMKFPPEIRDMIYMHLLTVPEPLRIRAKTFEPTDQESDADREESTYHVKDLYYSLLPLSPEGLNATDSPEQEESDSVPTTTSASNKLCPQILCVSRTIYHEAKHLLYADNKFMFCNAFRPGIAPYKREWVLIIRFLEAIGKQNAKYMRHILLCFPPFHMEGRFDPANATLNLKCHGNKALDLMVKWCTSIHTVEISLDNEWESIGPLHRAMIFEDASEALESPILLVNRKLRGMKALKRILVESQHTIYDEVRNKFVECGWEFTQNTLGSEDQEVVQQDWDISDTAYNRSMVNHNNAPIRIPRF